MLKLKPTYKVVKDYYDELQKLNELSEKNEGAVSPAFASLLKYCGKQFDWTLVEQYTMKKGARNIRLDGALVDTFKLVHGAWEAKDTKDDLDTEIKKKFAAGYPKDNIIFQSPDRIVIYQNGIREFDDEVTQPAKLIEALKIFFSYEPPAIHQWKKAVEEFKPEIPKIAKGILELIEEERKSNKKFIAAFESFAKLCRESINPNLSTKAVEEMLIQHLLTARIFSKVFDNPDFVNRNIIAREIETVINALTSRHFSRRDFLKSLDRFYVAIESTAATIDDYTEKQSFLNTIYEKFFQGFSIKVADTHGIVYTPQPIVDFMVNSVEDILQKEFGRSLSDKGVHILDPFVGTGNFILRVMRQIKKTSLEYKYKHELHCNEVMLLPYYIASMNIEHTYYELTGTYEPFDGICLVDTFELAEEKQTSLFTTENTQRVERQKESPIFVIIGNPPYNAGQINENDNSKNRKYPVIDQKVYETYAKDSKATLVNQLSDPYVKAIRFASDRIGDEGIVAFVTNNSFIDGIAFDGMRKHLEGDFDKIYHINLKGNARTSGERRRKEAGNIFDDMIRVSVGITFFIKNKNISKEEIEFYIYSIDDYLKSRQKKEFLIDKQSFVNVNFEKRVPTKNHIWLNKGIREDFEDFIPIGSKKAKRAKKKEEIQTIFKIYGRGVCSNGDAYVYNFNEEKLKDIAKGMVEDYNSQRDRWIREGQPKDLRNFLDIDEKVLKWIRHTKRSLKRGLEATFDEEKIRTAIYRPFCKKYYYFERIFNEDLYRIPKFFPTSESEKYNRVICVKSRGMSKPFHALMVSCIPDVQFTPNGQCFPFYVYDDAGNATENITDWCLEQFRDHYGVGVDLCVNPNNTKGEHTGSPLREITKWDIFYYVYALLHHPFYRKRYAANLKRELPRIPFASNFFEFAEIGQKLAALHIGYEDADEYPLDMIENPDEPLDWRVEKMRIRNKPKKYSRRKSRKKGKSQKPSKPAHIIYNVFLTLGGIPPETFDYRLGNRSALEWIVDRYRIKTDKRSGIMDDPNRDDDPQYIVRLIKKIVTVSLETVELVEMLAEFNIEEGETTK